MTDTIIYISLNKLVKSVHNVRKTEGASIEGLAASIAAHGLLHPLHVVAQVDDAKEPTGQYEVIAGSRRLRALKALAKRRDIKRTHPVACIERQRDEATEISLAENILREAMHPADEFEAMRALVEQDKTEAEIAARFGCSERHVARMLKLARVCPELFALYRQDDMHLEQLMAFTVSDDHAAQRAAWFDVPPYDRSPFAIKRRLTEQHIDANDRRVTFVGIAAYIDAGGVVVRDLFEQEHEGYLADPQLLDRLVRQKLEHAAAEVQAEGWRWVEIAPQRDVQRYADYGRGGAPAEAGAVVTIDHQGRLDVIRGLLRPEDAPNTPEQDCAVKPATISQSLQRELAAQRVAALRAELVAHPKTAKVALLYDAVMSVFPRLDQSVLEVRFIQCDLTHQGRSLEESEAVAFLKRERDQWEERIPGEAAELWDYLWNLDAASRDELLALCLAHSLNQSSDRMVNVLRLDMTRWWQPTEASYLGRVSRDLIAQAVEEVKGVREASYVRSLPRKADAVAYAERVLSGTGWLPEALRDSAFPERVDEADEYEEALDEAA